MSIVPSGKARLMVAQNISSSFVEGEAPINEDGYGPISSDKKNISNTVSPIDMEEANVGNTSSFDSSLKENLSNKKDDKKNRKTLTSYIFEKLQSYGYPGRRLQEFKSEFVEESLSPDGAKDIEVVIPDKKYPNEDGFTDTIENEELKEIVSEINEFFGLHFNGANRNGGKWTIKFTSANIEKTDDKSSFYADSLDQVYGKSDKSNSQGKNYKKPAVKSFTMMDMIKEAKNDFVNKIKKNGE